MYLQINKLKSLKVAKWRKDEWRMMKNDDGWMKNEEWWFQAVEGFCFQMDVQTDKWTVVNVELLLQLKSNNNQHNLLVSSLVLICKIISNLFHKFMKRLTLPSLFSFLFSTLVLSPSFLPQWCLNVLLISPDHHLEKSIFLEEWKL